MRLNPEVDEIECRRLADMRVFTNFTAPLVCDTTLAMCGTSSVEWNSQGPLRPAVHSTVLPCKIKLVVIERVYGVSAHEACTARSGRPGPESDMPKSSTSFHGPQRQPAVSIRFCIYQYYLCVKVYQINDFSG